MLGRIALFAVSVLSTALFAQELNLQQYLQRLKSAPGVTVSDKVEFLSSTGVTLSDQGMRDLDRAAGASSSSRRSTYNPWQSTSASQAETDGNTWPAPAKRRSIDSWNDKSTNGNSSRSWSSTTNTIGQFEYYNSNIGISGYSNRIGNQTYYNFSNGVSGSTSEIGNQRYHNLNNGLNGTTNRVGQYEYHNFNNGVSGTSNRIGNFTYLNLSDGTRCVSNKIGNQTYTNCNK